MGKDLISFLNRCFPFVPHLQDRSFALFPQTELRREGSEEENCRRGKWHRKEREGEGRKVKECDRTKEEGGGDGGEKV